MGCSHRAGLDEGRPSFRAGLVAALWLLHANENGRSVMTARPRIGRPVLAMWRDGHGELWRDGVVAAVSRARARSPPPAGGLRAAAAGVEAMDGAVATAAVCTLKDRCCMRYFYPSHIFYFVKEAMDGVVATAAVCRGPAYTSHRTLPMVSMRRPIPTLHLTGSIGIQGWHPIGF